MITNMAHAPNGIPLSIIRIANQEFASRLARLGIHEGTKITRQAENVSIGPVKVRGSKGETVLSGWLAGHVVMHLDNDRRIPLLECPPGSSGHVEGLTGHKIVEEALEHLGIKENDQIVFIRRIPPMTYKVLVADIHHEQLNEELAAKLLGDTSSGSAQFCSVGSGEQFTVRYILSGKSGKDIFRAMHIEPGVGMRLLSVSTSQVLNFSDKKAVVCITEDDLRLYLKESDAGDIIVTDEAKG